MSRQRPLTSLKTRYTTTAVLIGKDVDPRRQITLTSEGGQKRRVSIGMYCDLWMQGRILGNKAEFFE